MPAKPDSNNHAVALITGAAQRIGATIARTLHQRGYRVLLHYRNNVDAAQTLAAELNQQRGDSCRCLQADLCQIEQVEQLAQQAVQAFGRLDVLINNASDFYPTAIGNATADDWHALFGSNLQGPFFLSQALTPALRQQHGCIVNLIDIHAEKPLREHTLYCMAKAGLRMMTLSLAKELGPEVRVNGVAPGAILWPEQGQPLDEQAQQGIIERTALKRTGTPEDISRTVIFLVDGADYITGQIIAVDGGRSLSM